MVMSLMKFTVVLASLASCTDAAAILLSLLKELQKESQAIGHLGGISSQWCTDTVHQNTGMAQVIQGQLDDATIAVQQIRSDEKRLQSELTLARSTQQQREQQLQDATSTSNFATAEFTSERDQLNNTITATKHAMRLVKAQLQMDAQQQQQLGSADVIVNNLLQTGGDHMTEDEKNIMSEYTNDPKPLQTGVTGERPQELLKTLNGLHARLLKEQGATFSEHQVMALRLWSFTDHLNSSIMESKSQSASIGMEMAQRKREHTRLDGKIGALNGLLKTVEASKQATASMCSSAVQHQSQVEKFIADESDSVRTTLKRMPALSSELLFDLSTVLPAAPSFTSFLQIRQPSYGAAFLRKSVKSRHQAKPKPAPKVHDAVSPILKDLDAMAKQFPEDKSTFADAEHRLMSRRSAQTEATAAQGQKPADGINGFASSSIQDIYAFLKSDDQSGGSEIAGEERMLLSNSGDLNKVTGIYQGLLDNVHTKEKSVDDQLKWCGSIARDAKLDSDAVARSLKWTGAKLNLVRVAMSEYENTAAFNKLQQSNMDTRSVQLEKLTQVEDGQLQRSYDALKEYGQQLLSLVTELEQKASPEERKGAEVVRSLLDKLEKHQGLLQQWRAQAGELRKNVNSAFKGVQRKLADGVSQSSRRLVRLKVESQVLTSLASSKAKDKELSEKYVKLSQELCSSGKARQLQAKGAQLRQEAASVQKTLTALSQPGA